MNEAPRKPRSPIIVSVSVSHGNTAKVAEVIGQELGAEVVTPEDVDPDRVFNADLVGFGSGIFYQDLHPHLRKFVASLQPRTGREAFVFTSSGFAAPPWSRYTRRFIDALQHKGFDVTDTFNCRGWDTWLPFKLIGGHNTGRPDAADLDAARSFARRLISPRTARSIDEPSPESRAVARRTTDRRTGNIGV